MTAVYATIWLSMAGLLLAEFGRRRHRESGILPPWAVPVTAGAVALGIVHSVVALAAAYGWDHSTAALVAADRAARLYGVQWPGSIYANYVFLAFWALDTAWWWRAPAHFIRRAAWFEWLWRVLVFTMVTNAAVVFASPGGRLAGVPLVAGLLWAWRPSQKPGGASQ